LMYTLQGLHITLEKQNYAIISCVFQIIGYILGSLIGKYAFNSINCGLVLMTIFFIIITIVFFGALFKVMKVSVRKYLLNILISTSIIIILSFLVRFLFESFGIIEFVYALLKIQV